MALVMSPCFGRSRFSLGGPLCFTELVILKVPRRQACARSARHVTASTRVDWVETPVAHVFKVHIPGMKKEDIQIQVEDDRTLYISAEHRKEDVKEGGAVSKHVECTVGSKFMRKFRLPENADLEQIKAEVDSGVLTVTVPKPKRKMKSGPEIRKIEVSGGESAAAQATVSTPPYGVGPATSEQPTMSKSQETTTSPQ